MRKTYLLTLLVTLLFCYTSSAQTAKTVDVAQPGTLSVTLGEELKTVKNLTVTGKINTSDIDGLMQASCVRSIKSNRCNHCRYRRKRIEKRFRLTLYASTQH